MVMFKIRKLFLHSTTNIKSSRIRGQNLRKFCFVSQCLPGRSFQHSHFFFLSQEVKDNKRYVILPTGSGIQCCSSYRNRMIYMMVLPTVQPYKYSDTYATLNFNLVGPTSLLMYKYGYRDLCTTHLFVHLSSLKSTYTDE